MSKETKIIMDKIDIRDLIIRELKKEEIQLDHYNNAVLKHDYIKVAESIVEKLPIYNVLKTKLEGIDVVNVSFLYDFVNQFTDTEIPKKAIKESLDKLKNY